MATFEGECYIRKAGIGEDGEYGFLLKSFNPADKFDWTWFWANVEVRREYLAIAMAAITANKRVFVKLKEPETEYSRMSYFGLVKD